MGIPDPLTLRLTSLGFTLVYLSEKDKESNKHKNFMKDSCIPREISIILWGLQYTISLTKGPSASASGD